MSGMVGPLKDKELERAVEMDPTQVCGAFALTIENASICMAGTSVWVCETMARIGREDDSELERIARCTARVFVQAADGISKIIAERNDVNQPFVSSTPKVLPHQLINVNMTTFAKILDHHRSRLLRHYKVPEHVEAIGDQLVQLQRAFRKEEPLREMILDNQKSGSGFKKCWDDIYTRFPALANFCSGIASAFPNTATVESDFSMIGVLKNDYRTSLTDFSLEGILHCKQYSQLAALAAHTDVKSGQDQKQKTKISKASKQAIFEKSQN
ncbi:hypothetical protein F442_05618 [Phytophthora nicotianae P10297]|uniref:HAT C-terminal dimerisation domain-containing protein n=2 Tax=Phytophthora nicotianae TaxID=4792 RepID=W2QDK7_PHYN3|nr:hypothetical protein PPTG_10187 [Phytophthora nicotianae INRA-310]ETN11247.1 hypothetical protein PPTG_10187 [Phytophthora nicotianae INRA-310]ETP48704.1 hypothetical protein F442_05618 [Phytophthora nicotianae P10297]